MEKGGIFKISPRVPDMTSDGLGDMLEGQGDSADMCGGKFPLMLIEGRAEGLVCSEPGARTPIAVRGHFIPMFQTFAFYYRGQAAYRLQRLMILTSLPGEDWGLSEMLRKAELL